MSYDITLKYRPELLRGMKRDGLNKLLNQAQQRFYELRRQCSPHGRVKLVPKPHLWKKIKKDIARIKTVLAYKHRIETPKKIVRRITMLAKELKDREKSK